MTEGPLFYDMDLQELPVTWHRLRPEVEVEAAVPEPPFPRNMRPTQRLKRVPDPEAPRRFRTQAVPFDPLEGRTARIHEVGSGYDRYEAETFEHDPSAVAEPLGKDAPLTRPLGMPWEFGELLRAHDTAIDILRAYNFPTFRPRLHEKYARTIQPLAFAYAWAWQGDDLVWCEDPTGGGGAVYLREADDRDLRRSFTDSSGRAVAFVPSRLSWIEGVQSRLHDYLPPTSAFHWAWQVENLCWHSDALTGDSARSDFGEGLSRKAWRGLGSTGYFFGNWFTDFHSRRRHDATIRYGLERKPGAKKQGEAGRRNAQERAWKRWGEIVQPWVDKYIRESDESNLGVAAIHSAVLKAIGNNELEDVPVPNDDKTFGATLKLWERNGLIPAWTGLTNHRKRKQD